MLIPTDYYDDGDVNTLEVEPYMAMLLDGARHWHEHHPRRTTTKISKIQDSILSNDDLTPARSS